jgi:colanic acid biosynthesis glycosyl transferase WcaI
MRISIVSINYAPEATGIAVYSRGMAEYLVRNGHEVVVHTGFAYYPTWRKSPGDRGRLYRRERLNGVDVRRTYLYVPAHPSVIGRIIHEATFIVGALVAYLAARRADLTIVVSPPMPLGLPLLLGARLKGSQSIFHVQDLQPDAALDLGMLRPGLLASILFAMEAACYRWADYVSTISKGMLDRIRSKGVDARKLLVFRNWANDRAVQPLDRMTGFRREWSLEGCFVVLYSGNMGVKQGLDILLDAAGYLAVFHDIVFLIVGDGGEKERLVAAARVRGLLNVRFQPLQPFERLAELLATADVSVIPQRGGLSDIVLPSKLCNHLASGRPVVVTADPGSDLAQIVSSGPCGLVVPPEDAPALAAAILQLRDQADRRERFGRNAVRVMRAMLSEEAVLDGFAATLERIARDESVPARP